ncbi:hypothetical protein FACS189499_08990 [Clostridia bacterium]|nr:hypothetical protein FACS189499_08990 [Clostridia bacterium]
MAKTVKDFYNELQNHTDFIEKNKNVKNEAEYIKSVVEYANSNGYSFTEDELKTYTQSMKELKDADLKAVAGGWNTGTGVLTPDPSSCTLWGFSQDIIDAFKNYEPGSSTDDNHHDVYPVPYA